MQQPTGGASTGGTTAYRVGDLVVDVARARVTRAGVELPLPKLSFDLLLALVEAAPRIVSLDELMDRVWAGVIVSPETVSQRAKLLRDALGDDSKAPRYVAAVRGRGYRLVADVSPHVEQDARAAVTVVGVDAVPTPAADPARGWLGLSWRHSWLVGSSILLLALVAVFFAARQERRENSVSTTAAVAPIAEPSVAVLPFESLGGSSEVGVLAF
ncbi:MAG: hypothetical protein RL261_1472, partial [Pseudomonadota bacterium]